MCEIDAGGGETMGSISLELPQVMSDVNWCWTLEAGASLVSDWSTTSGWDLTTRSQVVHRHCRPSFREPHMGILEIGLKKLHFVYQRIVLRYGVIPLTRISRYRETRSWGVEFPHMPNNNRIQWRATFHWLKGTNFDWAAKGSVEPFNLTILLEIVVCRPAGEWHYHGRGFSVFQAWENLSECP